MTDRRPTDELNAIEGADEGALGLSDPPASAPEAAMVEDAEHLVPGPKFDQPIREAKPWNTGLAYQADQAGVANDPPAAQEEQFPEGDDEAI